MEALLRWFARPRRVLLLFALACTVLAAIAARVPLGYLPGTIEKSILVTVELDGAFEAEVEREIIVPLEQALGGLAGLQEITSVCDRGKGRVRLLFVPEADLDQAYLEVRAAVEAAYVGLPRRTQRPVVLKSDPSGQPVFVVAFPASSGLPAAADGIAAPEPDEDSLRRAYGAMEGAGEIGIGGGARHDVLVRFDPRKLAAAGLQVHRLVSGIRQANVVGGFGVEGQTPGVLDARFRSLDELRALYLAPGLRLEEVAEVAFVRTPAQSIARVNGGARLLVYVQAAGDANTVALCRRLRRLTAELPGGEVLFDQGGRIEQALRELAASVVTGIVLVVLLIAVCERRFAAALVMSAGIPFAILAAAAAVCLSGRELDVMSLAGIAVGVGLAVDAGVLLVEEYFRAGRRLERVMASVFRPVVFSTATTLAVFVPLGFGPRELRDALGGLAVAVAAAVTASVVYVFLVLPVLLDWIHGRRGSPETTSPQGRLSRPDRHARGSGRPRAWALLAGRRPAGGCRGESRRRTGCRGGTFRAGGRRVPAVFFAVSRLRVPVLVGLAAAVAAAALVGARLPREPFGAGSAEGLRFFVEFPSGWTKEAVLERTEPLERFLCALEGVRLVSGKYERERADFYLSLEDDTLPESVAARIRGQAYRYREGFFYFPQGEGTRRGVTVVLTGPGLETLRRLSGELAGRIRALPGVAEVVFHFKEVLPSTLLAVDLEKTRRTGVNPAELYQQLLWYLSSPVAGKWSTGPTERDIRVGAAGGGDTAPPGLAALLDLPVVTAAETPSRPAAPAADRPPGGPSGSGYPAWVSARPPVPGGRTVRAGELVAPVQEREHGRIHRWNRRRSLSFEVLTTPQPGRGAAGQIEALVQGFAFPPEYRGELRIQAAQTRLGRGVISSLVLALVLILYILVFQFESLYPAGIVLLQVPLSFVLPLAVLRAAGLALSVPAAIGLLLTAGIAVNNAILVLDALRGHRPWLAALSAPRLYHALASRFRAMLVASLTTVLGVVPLLFAGPVGRGVLAPLSLTIAAGIAGSFVALILTLAAVGRRVPASDTPASA